MSDEVWIDLPGYEGIYQVSSAGKMRNRKGRILKGFKSANGRLYFCASKDGVQEDIWFDEIKFPEPAP